MGQYGSCEANIMEWWVRILGGVQLSLWPVAGDGAHDDGEDDGTGCSKGPGCLCGKSRWAGGDSGQKTSPALPQGCAKLPKLSPQSLTNQ